MGASLIVSIGVLAFLLVAAYMLYQISRLYQIWVDKEEKFEVFEGLMLGKLAKKKGIDLDKEITKHKMTARPNFRKKLEKEIITEMFGKEKE